MRAEQVIELGVGVGGLVFAEPPQPVTALRRVQGLEGLWMTLGSGAAAVQNLPCLPQEIPGPILLDLADPGSKVITGPRAVLVDPARMEQVIHPCQIRHGMGCDPP